MVHQLAGGLTALQGALDTRYLSGAGFSLLLYDHFLTFSDEVDLVWKAPNSFSKWAFLLNRYVVAIAHITCALQMGLNVEFSQKRLFMGTTAIGILSLAIAKMLVLLRVIRNWDWNRTAVLLLFFGYTFSVGAQNVALIVTLIQLYPSTTYNTALRMCVVTGTTPALIAVWAFPLLFEFLVLISSFWNAFDRPRDAKVAIRDVLISDGVAFFIALMLLRTINLVLAATSRGLNAYLGVLFIWSAITIILNRSILFFLRQERNERLPVLPVHPTRTTSGISEFERFMCPSPTKVDLETMWRRELDSFGFKPTEPESASLRPASHRLSLDRRTFRILTG